MNQIMQFISSHDVGIGIVGTMVVIVGVVSGYGRRHRRGTAPLQPEDRD